MPGSPNCVHYVTIFADLYEFINSLPNEIHTVLIVMIGSVNNIKKSSYHGQLDTIHHLEANPGWLTLLQRVFGGHGLL